MKLNETPKKLLLELVDAWREKQPGHPSREDAVDYLIKELGLDPEAKALLLRK